MLIEEVTIDSCEAKFNIIVFLSYTEMLGGLCLITAYKGITQISIFIVIINVLLFVPRSILLNE